MTTTPSPGAIALPVHTDSARRVYGADGCLIAVATNQRHAEQIARALNLHSKLAKAARIASDVMARSNNSMTVDEIVSIREAADAVKYEAEDPTEQKEKLS